MQEKITENTLIIPTGLVFEMDGGSLTIGNTENIVVRGNISKPVRKVFSKNGDIYLTSNREFEAETIEAERGKVVVSGKIKVNMIRGTHIEFNKGSIKAKAIIASNQISIDGDRLEVDLLMAPTITVGPKTSGRATVMESQNEVSPNQLRGCFRISEFNEIFPNAGRILREVESAQSLLKGGVEISIPEPPVAPGVEEGEGFEGVQEEMVEVPDVTPPLQPPEEDNGIPLQEIATSAPGPSLEEEEGVEEGAGPAEGGERVRVLVPPQVIEKITSAGEKMRASYEGEESPPAVNFLLTLIEEEKFDTIAKYIDNIWKDILSFHKEKGVLVPSIVTNMIKFIRENLEGLNL